MPVVLCKMNKTRPLSQKWGVGQVSPIMPSKGLAHACTVRRWVDKFVANNGGHYNNTLMSNEELCERARVYVRENAAPRGRPNLTARAFCQWVNNELLPNYTLDPGYPRRVSLETARKWLHDLGFDVLHMLK